MKNKIIKLKYTDTVNANVGGRSIHEDIPTEVLETFAILQKGLVGEFLYNKAIETIKKYPQYFSGYVIIDNVVYSKDDKTNKISKKFWEIYDNIN